MRTSGFLRMLVVAAAAIASTYAHEGASLHERHLAVGEGAAHAGNLNHLVQETHVSRVLHKKHKKATPAPAPAEEEEAAEEEPAPAPAKKHKKKAAAAEEETEEAAEEAEAPAPAPTTTAPAPAPTTAAPPATEAPAPAPAPAEEEEEETAAPKTHKKSTESEEETSEAEGEDTKKKVNDKKIEGKKKEGVIDHSSEGSAEIDKIDLRNADQWVSVYHDPPVLVIKASLYAFISYNDSSVCQTFNMTLNAVEQKADGNGTFAYHVVTSVHCRMNNEDETPGKFVLNFVPEGRRLLLTECGHRENGEIVNWLKITEEVPECMTPNERREFLSQSMKHVHASNGTETGEIAPKHTDFLTRLEELDPEEVAIVGSGLIAIIAVVIVVAVFIARKRKAQKDLERTIAGAKAEHAAEDDSSVQEETSTKERKNLVGDDKKSTDVEEGSFVNSPAVKV